MIEVKLTFFVKSMLDALFLSTHTLNLLFVLMKYTIPMIFHITVREICESFTVLAINQVKKSFLSTPH